MGPILEPISLNLNFKKTFKIHKGMSTNYVTQFSKISVSPPLLLHNEKPYKFLDFYNGPLQISDPPPPQYCTYYVDIPLINGPPPFKKYQTIKYSNLLMSNFYDRKPIYATNLKSISLKGAFSHPISFKLDL